MTQLAFQLLTDSGIESIPNIGFFLSQSIGAICLFGIFLPISAWLSTRRKEREAYYKAETLRRIAEAPVEGAKETRALLEAQERANRFKTREGMKLGGVICIGAGLGVAIFLFAIAGHDAPVYLVGLIPMLVGAALLAYVYMLAAPLE